MMSMNVTGGRYRNTLSRVYDRLRKRSLRNWDDIYRTDHEAYVAGVRDALNAVEVDNNNSWTEVANTYPSSGNRNEVHEDVVYDERHPFTSSEWAETLDAWNATTV